MRLWWSVVSLVAVACVAVSSEERQSSRGGIEYAPVIETMEGKVRGKIMSSRKGKTIYAYLGIPYAKPPVGDRRFTNPQKANEWKGVKDATQDRSVCPQLTFPTREYAGDEDCLYLNVYTTRLPVNNSREGTIVWDVLVLIHGGGFTFGSGHYHAHSPEHLLDEDMVLVTFNYRLGPLGFLATGDGASQGNFGLKDQLNVLRWVRGNIDRFSGNPSSVTLLGAQAGGASVHYHLLSPLSNNMFHGAISTSGTALTPWAHLPMPEAKQRAFKLGDLVGCKHNQDSNELVICLRKKSTEDIVKKSTHVIEWVHDLLYPFVPVTEPLIPGKKSFLHDDPENLITNLRGRQALIPWIIGVNSHEGLPQALQMMIYRTTLQDLNNNPSTNLPLYLGMAKESLEERKHIAQRAWDFYIRNETLDYSNLKQLAAGDSSKIMRQYSQSFRNVGPAVSEESLRDTNCLTTDYNYFYGLTKSVHLHSTLTDANVFVYHFSYTTKDSRFFLGVPQGDDIRYLLPESINGEKIRFEDKDFTTVECMVKLFANFARDGDPTPGEENVLNNIIWPAAEDGDFHYIDIGDSIQIETGGFYKERIEFWETVKETSKDKLFKKDEL